MRAILLLIALIGVSTVRAGKLNVLIVLDGTTSVCGSPHTCGNWAAAIKFCHDMVATWTVGKDDTLVALAKFGDDARVEWALDRYTDKDLLLKAIDAVVFPGGGLTIVGAVATVVQQVFLTTLPLRLDARNIVIIITDGEPAITLEQATAASLALSLKGVTIFAVGIQTGCTEAFAHALATSPKELDKTFFLADYYVGDDTHTGIESVRASVLHAVNVF